jgi:hypothetical protein
MDKLMIDQGIMTLVTIATFAMCGALALYVIYSVIWRAVRRGMREYANSVQPVVSAQPPTTTRVIRRLPVRVPNYVPNDWT